MEEQKVWQENFYKAEKTSSFINFMNLFSKVKKDQRKHIKKLFESERFDMLYRLQASGMPLSYFQKRAFNKEFKTYLQTHGLDFIESELHAKNSVSDALLLEVLFSDNKTHHLDTLAKSYPQIDRRLKQRQEDNRFKSLALQTYDRFIDNLLNESKKRPNGFKSIASREFSTSRFTDDIDVNYYRCHYYARVIILSSNAIMLSEMTKLTSLSGIEINNNLDKLKDSIISEINQYREKNTYRSSTQMVENIYQAIVPDEKLDLAISAMKKHINDLLKNNEQAILSSISGIEAIERNNPDMDLSSIPPSFKPVIDSLDGLLQNIEKHSTMLSLTSRQEFQAIQLTHLPETLRKYFQMPLEFREEMKNANGLNATQLTLETLKEFEKKLQNYKEELGMNMIREVSVNHKYQKMR